MWQCPGEWGQCRGRLSPEVGESMRDMPLTEARADAADIGKGQSIRGMWAKFRSLSFILGVLDSLKDGEYSRLEGNGLIRKFST